MSVTCYLIYNIIMTESSQAFQTWLKGKTLRDKAVEVSMSFIIVDNLCNYQNFYKTVHRSA